MSYAQHYAVFVYLFKENNIRCSLIEEGTGTYEAKEENPIVNINFYSEVISSIILFHYPDLKFRNVYGTYPILLKRRLNAQKFVEFKGTPSAKSSTRIGNIIHKCSITGGDIIYANQEYLVEHTLFAGSLISILLRIGKPDSARILIEPRPREPKKNISTVQKVIKKAKCHDIILITKPDFLIEPVIKKAKIKHLIGLTSSSLIYAPLVSERCQSYSTTPLMMRLYDNGRSQKGINTLCLHFDTLKNFDNVKVLSDDITSPSLHDKGISLGEQ